MAQGGVPVLFWVLEQGPSASLKGSDVKYDGVAKGEWGMRPYRYLQQIMKYKIHIEFIAL